MKPRFITEQKLTLFTNKYSIFGAGPEGAKTSLLSFAQQKKFSFKEKVMFYADEQKSSLAFTFRAEKVLDVHGRYFVEDENGQLLGMFKKQFAQSFISSTWQILDKDGNPLFEVSESNIGLALLRRYGLAIPVIGWMVEIATNFLKYHFQFKDLASGEKVGMYQKTTLFRDRYLLSTTDEAFEKVDWRVTAAFTVALDALQSR